MSENKYCGNCKHFKDVDADGFVQCNRRQFKYRPFRNIEACEHHEFLNGGWTEITPDNVDEVDCIDQEKVVIGWLDNKGRQHIAALVDCPPVKSSLAGKGYYYYVLPELKIE